MIITGEMDKIFNPDGTQAVTFVNENKDGLKTIGVATSSIESLRKQSLNKNEEPVVQNEVNNINNVQQPTEQLNQVAPAQSVPTNNEVLEDLTNREIAPATTNDVISQNPIGDIANTSSFDKFVPPKFDLPQSVVSKEQPQEVVSEMKMPEMPTEVIANAPVETDPNLFNIDTQVNTSIPAAPQTPEQPNVLNAQQQQSVEDPVPSVPAVEKAIEQLNNLNVVNENIDNTPLQEVKPVETPVLENEVLNTPEVTIPTPVVEETINQNIEQPIPSVPNLAEEVINKPENLVENTQMPAEEPVINNSQTEEFIADTPFTIPNEQVKEEIFSNEQEVSEPNAELPKVQEPGIMEPEIMQPEVEVKANSEPEVLETKSDLVEGVEPEVMETMPDTKQSNDLQEQVEKLRSDINNLIDEFVKNMNITQNNVGMKEEKPSLDLPIPDIEIPSLNSVTTPEINTQNKIESNVVNDLPTLDNVLPTMDINNVGLENSNQNEKNQNPNLENPILENNIPPVQMQNMPQEEVNEQLISGGKFGF